MGKDEESGPTVAPPVSIQPPSSPSSSPAAPKIELHPAFFVGIWIFFSGSVILFNKWVLDTAGFRFPIFLTTWHLVFATIMTQILARTTSLLDGLKTVKMDGRTYVRAICPIGFFFCLSLICSNQAYLYLSVAFIQMLKASMPVVLLLVTWAMRIEPPNLKVLGNVSVIVFGVIIASYGEIHFVLIGVIFQSFGLLFEASRLALVQKLLSSPEYKMDPLVSLYYFAPVCAAMNALCCIIFEGPRLSIQAILDAGLVMLFMNAAVAFCLNVAVVFLIGKTSSLALTLSGVLKDILLVVLSVIIWSTPITAIQMIGYSIALGGLIWYKIGGDQAYAAYTKLAGDENSTFNRFRRSLWAKVGAGVLILFVVFALFHGLTRGQGYDSAAVDTSLTGTPQPDMVDAYNPEYEGIGTSSEYVSDMPSHDMVPGNALDGGTESLDWDDYEESLPSTAHYDAPSTHYDTPSSHHDTSSSSGSNYGTQDLPATRPLDIVIYVPSNQNNSFTVLESIFSLPSLSAQHPHIVAYTNSYPEIQVAQHIPLTSSLNSPSAAYAHYITNNYENLAEQTVFLHSNINVRLVETTISARFMPRTGVADLSPNGYDVCTCMDCVDVHHEHLTKTDELYALTNSQICLPQDQLLLSADALFIASASRVRRNPVAVYTHLLNALEGHNADLEKSMAKSWLFMLGCNDISISSRCRSVDARVTDCQCMD